MATYTLDGSRIRTEGQFWEEYVVVVQPNGAEYFGRNLNAFNDALSGGPGWPGDNLTLRILHSKELSNAVGAKFLESIRDICIDSKRAKLDLL
jgi:hypothetical protein